MIDKSCECQKRYSSESCNPCMRSDGKIHCECECHIRRVLSSDINKTIGAIRISPKGLPVRSLPALPLTNDHLKELADAYEALQAENAELREAVAELVQAEWMVSTMWTTQAARDVVLNIANAALEKHKER